MQVVIVMPGEELMGRAGFCKEICHFYEKQLARVRRCSITGLQVVPRCTLRRDAYTLLSIDPLSVI